MIVIYHAKTFTPMQTVEDRLIKFAQQQINNGKYACQLINDKHSQRLVSQKTQMVSEFTVCYNDEIKIPNKNGPHRLDSPIDETHSANQQAKIKVLN